MATKIKFNWQRHKDSFKIEYKGFKAVIDKWGWAIFKDGERVTWGTHTGRDAKKQAESWLFANTE